MTIDETTWAVCTTCFSTMADTGDYLIREATQEDKQAVLALRKDVYGGRDYLPEYYDDFGCWSNVTPFVLLHKDEIIGFSVAFIVDDGETLVARASRISQDYEGKDLFGYLDKYVCNWAKERGATVKAFTASALNTSVCKASFRAQNTLVLSKSYLIYTIEAESMCLKETDQLLGEELESVSSETLHKYMCLEEYSTTFFSEGRVLVNSVPFKLISSNVQFILKDEHTTSFSDIHNTTDGLLSFGTLYRVQSYSYQYTINIYGNDLKCLRRHLMRHLMELKSKASGSICILMPVRKDFPCETVDSIFSELGFERQNKLGSAQAKPWITCDFLFERKL